MPKIATVLFGDLPFLPMQAERPLSESLAWLTDVTEAHNSSEDRVQLRSMPRQTFVYTLPISAANFARTFNVEYGALRQRWAVPLWTEAQYVGTVAGTTIACDTTNFDLRADSLALLYRDSTHWQVVEIETVSVGSVELYSAADALTGAFLMPVRLGYIAGNVDKPSNGYNAKSKMTFEIEDNMPYSADVPTQFLANDIYFEPSIANGFLDRSLEQQQDIVDGQLGKVFRRTTWANPRFGSPYKTITSDAQEMRAYKDWLYRRAGKFRSFWLPSFEMNLRCANVGNIVSTLYATRDSYFDYATARTHIAIEDTAGNWYARTVSSPVEVSGDRVQLTLSSPLNVDASLIRRISYLGLYRLDTDSVEIQWIGNSVTQSDARVLELSP